MHIIFIHARGSRGEYSEATAACALMLLQRTLQSINLLAEIGLQRSRDMVETSPSTRVKKNAEPFHLLLALPVAQDTIEKNVLIIDIAQIIAVKRGERLI